MGKTFTIDDILNANIVKNVVKTRFATKETEVIKRPASFIIRLKNEPEDRVFRIILLPPHGFTADTMDETNPHPEVRKAKIEIKGGVRPNKSGFNLLKKCIRYQYYTVRNIKITEDKPYPKINGEYYKENMKSSKQIFFVVKEDGIGFYHSLVNLSNEWILLSLDKELRLQRAPELQSKIANMDKNKQRIITLLYKKILLLGDTIFKKEPRLIEEICNFDVDKIIPRLIEMLNVLETGKHEPCTVYAIILKIGKKNVKVIDYLKEAVERNVAQKYYLDELIKKLTA